MTDEPGRASRHQRYVWLVVFLAVWGLITHGTHAGSGDAPHYLVMAASIAFDGDLDLRNDYALRGNPIGDDVPFEPETHARPGRDGALRPVHDIGMPLLFAPYVPIVHGVAAALGRIVPERWLRRARLTPTLIRRHLISLAMAAVAGLLAVQLVGMLRSIVPPRIALMWGLLVALSPPIVSHAFLFFTEIPSALVCFWTFRQIVAEDEARARSWWLPGLAIGSLVLLHIRNIGLAAGLFVLGMRRLRQSAADLPLAIGFIVGTLAPLAVSGAITYRFWGTVLTTPHARADWSLHPGDAGREAFVRLSGLLFDQEFGLLPYAPIYLLALPGLVVLRARSPRLFRAIAFMVAVYVLTLVVPYINVHGWTGGWSPAARFLVPVAPLLAIAVVAYASGARAPGKHVVSALVLLQLVIDVVVWQWPKVLWNTGDGTGALVAWWPALSEALPAWSRANPSAAPFLIAGVGALVLTMLLAWSLNAPEANPDAGAGDRAS